VDLSKKKSIDELEMFEGKIYAGIRDWQFLEIVMRNL